MKRVFCRQNFVVRHTSFFSCFGILKFQIPCIHVSRFMTNEFPGIHEVPVTGTTTRELS